MAWIRTLRVSDRGGAGKECSFPQVGALRMSINPPNTPWPSPPHASLKLAHLPSRHRRTSQRVSPSLTPVCHSTHFSLSDWERFDPSDITPFPQRSLCSWPGQAFSVTFKTLALNHGCQKSIIQMPLTLIPRGVSTNVLTDCLAPRGVSN